MRTANPFPGVVLEAEDPLALDLHLPGGEVVNHDKSSIDIPLGAHLTGICREPGTNSSDDSSPVELDSARSFCCST